MAPTGEELAQGVCVPCHGGDPALTEREAKELLRDVPGWQVIEREGVPRLERVFHFSDFAQALSFSDAVGAAAEEQGHHPALLTEWGRATVWWWTHAINGLHRNDFIMAARTSDLYSRSHSQG